MVRIILVLAIALSLGQAPAGQPEPTRLPLVRVVDLDVGEAAKVELANKQSVSVKLVDLNETRDPIRGAVRVAKVKVEVDGKLIELISSNYNLPKTVGMAQIDCSITRGYTENSNTDAWGLVKAARLRLWPANSPLQQPGTFVYPAKQRWFASATQMANEPTWVDGGERPVLQKADGHLTLGKGKIYYHYGLDIGGPEDLVDVIAATDGLVVSSATNLLPGFENTPAKPRYDVIYLLDDQGWYYRYSHLVVIDPAVKPGARVKMGQKIGVLGKEGGSGGWSHLHFDITSKQPSGKWGIQEGYAFLWEAYRNEYKPTIQAVARPHHFAWTDEPVVLDASRSWSAAKIVRYDWTFGDGTTAQGPTVQRFYPQAGAYSEILKIVDDKGQVDYDFAVVQVLDRKRIDRLPPTIHAAYFPTFGIKPGDPVTFKVRSFVRNSLAVHGEETWDFGDGTAPVKVKSDGNAKQHAKDGYAVTTHRYSKPGHYLVRVEQRDSDGHPAIARLHVRVGLE